MSGKNTPCPATHGPFCHAIGCDCIPYQGLLTRIAELDLLIETSREYADAQNEEMARLRGGSNCFHHLRGCNIGHRLVLWDMFPDGPKGNPYACPLCCLRAKEKT